jgi:hypothetical protein
MYPINRDRVCALAQVVLEIKELNAEWGLDQYGATKGAGDARSKND